MKNVSHHNADEWFSASQAAKLSGLTLSMLNYLCREGVVEPTCNCPRGHGARRHYSFGDVVALRLVAQISKAGISVGRLKNAMRRLRKLHPQITLTSLPASHVITDGKDMYLCQPGEFIERAFDGQLAFAFVIELTKIQQELAQKIPDVQRTKSVSKRVGLG